MKSKLSYRNLLEGIIKFNIIFFVVMLYMVYSGRVGFEEYYTILGQQLYLIFFTFLVGKAYLKFHGHKTSDSSMTRESVYIGLVGTVIITYFRGVYLGDFPFNVHLLLLVVMSLVFGMVYWHVVFALKKMTFLDRVVSFLDIEFTYKDFVYLVMILNASFIAIIAMVLLVGPQTSRGLVESLFVIVYFQIAFFIFHFVVGKCVDFVWHKKTTKFGNVSMLGMVMGSIFYVTKINIVDKSLLHLFYFSSDKGGTPLFAVVTLILFWVFFALLFHFEVKYPLGKKMIKKGK
ncbi:MAG: hypothetical protein K0T99_04345 [Alphaproteobacteria bacterium]|nr:hypothetical protein [Alphaproteobacteria bacterium]